mmetsp:Transcript_1908/g.2608  ORF Transcript_1908/g.2608 Transcript_1908/m.2608 type:complete len:299 (+) Transcript_1908:238-1134(+)
MSRLQELLGKVPPISLGIIVICVVIQICVWLFDIDLHEYTINPRAVMYLHEYFRLWSSAFLHAGLMHIAMNMMSMAGIGMPLEYSIGSLTLLFLIIWSVFLSGSLYCLISWVAWQVTGDSSWMFQNAVGFSGVLFTLAVVESYKSTVPTRSIFGIVSVPTRVYPWVLMLALQIMVPQISFLGHLSGLLIGILYSYNCLFFVMPSTVFTQEMENWRIFQSLVALPSFQRCPDNISIEQIGDLLAHTKIAVGWLAQFVWNILQTLMAIVGIQGNNSPQTAASNSVDPESQRRLVNNAQRY